MKMTLIVIGAIALIVAMSIGIYGLGWWIEEDSVNRSAEINQNSYQRESALISAIVNDAAEVADLDVAIITTSSPELLAQRNALVDQVCRNATLLGAEATQLTGAAGVLVATECGVY